MFSVPSAFGTVFCSPIARCAFVRHAIAVSLALVMLVSIAVADPAPVNLDALGVGTDPTHWNEPRQPRTEADADRTEAAALFATGSAHQRRGELADALRCYQRAFRCDPQSPMLIKAVIGLTVQLQREAEAARYGLLAVSVTETEPQLLQALAAYQNAQGNPADAIRLYEKALAQLQNTKQARDTLAIRMELGRLCFDADRHAQAAEYFARVMKDIEHPADPTIDKEFIASLLGDAPLAYRQMGESFLEAGRLDEAQAMFDKSQFAAADKTTQEFLHARMLLKRGKPAEGLAAIDAALAANISGEGLVPYEVLRDSLDRLGKKDELIPRLAKLHAADPKNLSLGYFLAQQYQAAGKLDDAQRIYRELLAERPIVTVYRHLIDIARQMHRPDELLDTMGQGIERVGLLTTLSAEAQSVSGDAETVQAVIAAAKKRLASGPNKLSYGAIVAAASLALEAKQFDAAAHFFDAALAAEKSLPPTTPEAKDSALPRAAELYMLWGVGLLTGDRAKEAVAVFQQAIDAKAETADNPIFHFYLAGALALAERTDEALVAARVAADGKKDAARFQSRPAWVLYAGKRFDEATKAYRDVLTRFDADRDSADTRDALRDVRLTLSNIAVEQGDLAQAEEWLAQVLDEFPGDIGAMNDLGYLWADQNIHLQRAFRMIQRAVNDKPDNTAYRDSFGWVLFRLGKYREALVELEKAAAGKADGTVLEHLGDTYAKLQWPAKAQDAWRKAAAEYRKEQDVKRADAVEKKITKTTK